MLLNYNLRLLFKFSLLYAETRLIIRHDPTEVCGNKTRGSAKRGAAPLS